MSGMIVELRPNKEDILKHLDRLFSQAATEYPDAKIQIDCGDPSGSAPWAWEYFKITDRESAAGFAEKKNAEGRNIYVGVNPRNPDVFPGTAAKDEDILGAWFNFSDHDTWESYDKIKTTPVTHTFSVTTGNAPNKRVHLYWEREEPAINLKAWTDIQSGIAHYFGSDPVIDPRRIMRLAGTINYPSPKKTEKGYVPELVTIKTLYSGEERDAVDILELHNSFPSPGGTGSVEAGAGDGLNLPTFNNVPVDEYVKEIMAGEGEWHNKMIRVVAHWVSRGLKDAEIVMMARNFTQPGYTHTDTDREVQKAINGARAKWGVEEPGATASTPAPVLDESEPFSAATLSGTPKPREWLIEDWIPLNAITSLYGDGGIGKTLVAQQLATSVVLGANWLGMSPKQSSVLCVFCEDDKDELHRRQSAINDACNLFQLSKLNDLYIWPRVGYDNLLVTYNLAGQPVEAPLVQRIIDHAQEKGCGLIILDTVADTFGGNENDRAQVNYFVKTVVGRIRRETNATILLLAHPSMSGKASGDGGGGSTAWNNAVRSRLYLEKPENGLDEERTLTRKKSNYATSGDNTEIRLFWDNGVLERIDENLGSDTVTSIELNAAKREILKIVETEWEKGTPLKGKGQKGKNPRELQNIVIQTMDSSYDKALIAQAIREVKVDYIISDKKNDKRGYRLTDTGKSWLND